MSEQEGDIRGVQQTMSKTDKPKKEKKKAMKARYLKTMEATAASKKWDLRRERNMK